MCNKALFFLFMNEPVNLNSNKHREVQINLNSSHVTIYHTIDDVICRIKIILPFLTWHIKALLVVIRKEMQSL